MTISDNEAAVHKNKGVIWERIKSLDELPIYPSIVQQVLITAKEEEFYDRDLDYDEKYTEWLELRQGFIVAHLEQKKQCRGLGIVLSWISRSKSCCRPLGFYAAAW